MDLREFRPHCLSTQSPDTEKEVWVKQSRNTIQPNMNKQLGGLQTVCNIIISSNMTPNRVAAVQLNPLHLDRLDGSAGGHDEMLLSDKVGRGRAAGGFSVLRVC